MKISRNAPCPCGSGKLGDMYAWPMKAGAARDVERAKQIFEMGLSANATDKTDIVGRLRDLDEEKS